MYTSNVENVKKIHAYDRGHYEKNFDKKCAECGAKCRFVWLYPIKLLRVKLYMPILIMPILLFSCLLINNIPYNHSDEVV